ncbi:prepilin-type N-terminal cleavage/methylation domain-containing protein [Pyxidicoccus fallax]|uniref:Prepilin-type N-terminal cleavage/methylation domain-containing protein n=1 Tax=Pyxidicoccus fallax TaxID=394095 RepID=A0A848M2A4_9BACT|nr:prepilin-type N-terminal cleavage/methylation domain-containing protein [Pyxidicoccus fallax]NMO23603.1 prepilin-type N-terminal cleavage/methylation domain-containing protein [Pyxidicoccus fallax]NPC87051.1 prepilin-type N-terminal cleavage/methylation domain-containing protein [Pyxidicoccus fallax]
MRSRRGGFTLIEVAVVVAILSILLTLSVMALGVLPAQARMSGGVLELNAALSAARAHSLGRGVRTAVLIDTAEGSTTLDARVRHWTVVDPWFLLDEAMTARPSWRTPEELLPPLPAPSGSAFRVLATGQFGDGVRLAPSGFRSLASPPIQPGCMDPRTPSVELSSGTEEGSWAFPPPFCQVPDNAPCTFCSASGGTVRGAILFEPDGRVALLDALGREDARGAGSIVFGGHEAGADVRALVLLDTGLFRAFTRNP